MNEFKRLYSRNNILILLALIIINMGLFMLSCSPEKEITLTGETLESYIEEYPEFLENVKQSEQNMSLLNMYKSGFASDNIRKTAQSYSKLQNITVEYGDNRGIVLFIQYGLTDIFLIAFLLIMSIQLLKERKKGLVNLIRATRNGRGVLYFQRIAILAVSAIAVGILLYGGNFIGMLLTFGKGNLSRSVQSLPEFKQCTYNFTIGGYLIISCCLKIITCFVFTLAFFLIISILGTAAAYILAAVVTILEIMLFTLIIPVSSFNALKYINILAILKCDEFLSVCRNLNIFGKAVSAFFCNAVFLLTLFIILLITGYIIHGRMYVQNRNFLQGILNKISFIVEKISVQRTLFGWECFKLLVKQGGILFMAAAFLLTLNSALKYEYSYPINILEKSYYEKYQGEITKNTLENAESELAEIESTIEHFENAINDLLAKGEEYLSIPSEQMRMARLTNSLNEAQEKKDALMPVIKNIRDGISYTNSTGRSVNLIVPYTYDLLFNYDKQTARRASLFLLIGIIGALSGVFAYDRQNNMRSTLSSSYRGRGRLTVIKTGVVFIVCVLLCVSVHLIQVIQIGNFLGYNDIGVPVQSLMFMRDFKPYITIIQYIVMLFAVRIAAAFCVGIICTAVSRLCADTMSAMGVSIFVLAVPSVFMEIFSDNNIISCTYFLSGEYFR